jgi:hypothetical protein
VHARVPRRFLHLVKLHFLLVLLLLVLQQNARATREA